MQHMIPPPIPTAIGSPSRLFSLPASIERAMKCPKCREWLIRTDTGWTCASGIGASHTGLKSDETIMAEVGEAVDAIAKASWKNQTKTKKSLDVVKLLMELLWWRAMDQQRRAEQ